MNSGLWRWVTEGRGNVLSISVKRLLGLGHHSPDQSSYVRIRKSLIEFESFHFCSMASNLARGVDRDLGCLVFPIHHHNRHG
jgi:hypothetical protein